MDRVTAIVCLEYVRERCQILDEQKPPNDFFKTICESLNMAIEVLQEPEADIIHMCEWKPVEDFKTSPFVTSCGVTHWRQDEVSNFTFCPYCGERLKEVRRNE